MNDTAIEVLVEAETQGKGEVEVRGGVEQGGQQVGTLVRVVALLPPAPQGSKAVQLDVVEEERDSKEMKVSADQEGQDRYGLFAPKSGKKNQKGSEKKKRSVKVTPGHHQSTSL